MASLLLPLVTVSVLSVSVTIFEMEDPAVAEAVTYRLNRVEAAEAPAARVHVTTCPVIEQPGETLLIVRPEPMVSETVAVSAVGPPVLATVREMAPGPAWKVGVECAAERERDAGGS